MGEKESIKFGPFTPHSFMDTPIGASPIIAGNGNIVFAGQTAVGMATSCSSKIVARHNGEVEIVTPHFISIQGRTVIVSDFRKNLSIEIDILNIKAKKTINFAGIKEKIMKAIAGKEAGEDSKGNPTAAEPPTNYEDAFKANYESFDHPAFLKMFGLHLAEVLCSYQWERVRFRGDEKTFHETFAGIAEFKNYTGYCTECFETGTVRELEFFLTLGESDEAKATMFVPRCEEQVVDSIYELSAKINNDDYIISAMNIVMGSGTRIEYVAKKRVYSFSHGIIAKKSFVSSEQQGVFSSKLHVDVDSISFASLNFSNNVPDFCGNDTGLPSIDWDGDFMLSVTGSLTMASTEQLTISSTVQAIIAGGTRGIKITSSGSSAITF